LRGTSHIRLQVKPAGRSNSNTHQEKIMKKIFGSFALACILTASMAAFAQDTMKQDSSQDSMKKDDSMKNDSMKKDDSKKSKKMKKKDAMKKDDSMKKDDMKKDDSMKHDDMKQN
jgi:pentapeptide MXKDX repeat protein